MISERLEPWLPGDGTWHVRAHLGRICEALARHLAGRVAPDVQSRAALGDPLGIAASSAALRALAADFRRGEGRGTPRQHDSAVAPGATTTAEYQAIEARADAFAAQAGYLPLRHVARAFDLRPLELDALLLALAVELDGRIARAVSIANDHMGRPRPTLGLALEIAQQAGSIVLNEVEERRLIKDGLLELEGDGPVPTLSLRLDADVRRRLCAPDRLSPDVPGTRLHALEGGLDEPVVVDPQVRRRLEAWAAAAARPAPGRTRLAPTLLLAGAPGSGRGTLARMYARRAGYALVESEITSETLVERVRVARREARWHDAALLVQVPAGAGASLFRALWPRLADLPGPLLLALAPEDLEVAAGRGSVMPVRVELGPLTLDERSALWRTLLPDGSQVSDQEIDVLASRFRFGPAAVATCIERARGEVVRAPGVVIRDALDDAARALGAARMGSLAQRLPTPFERAALIVEPRVHAELDLAVAWIRRRRRVLTDWGFAARLPFGHGLTALFAGPPGTGKTMAAQILARELHMDLYRVDLSRVMSKYIGETEKNLAQLFDEAQAAGIALFFDEADALFGKRTESESAHDRYANVEIGYLLQRMEEYDGVTILATNRMGDMDEAFMRRFHITVKFQQPSADDRLRIWAGMLPAALQREQDLPLAYVAQRFELSGGEIKNAALAAAFLAADEGGPLGARHLARAIERELVKSGRIVDARALEEIVG